jgi:uncharacterized protein (TIGR02145 family)
MDLHCFGDYFRANKFLGHWLSGSSRDFSGRLIFFYRQQSNHFFHMKKIYLLFCLLTSSFLLFAQAPQGIPYQAIARNASGVAIANTAVKVRFTIRDSIATGAIKYQETHNPTTSALGLFSVNVGMGTVVNGTFSGINWGKNAKFLQVELNTTGGTTYTDLGTTQMMSVPYALHSKFSDAIKMRTSATGDTLYTGDGNYVIVPGISASNPSSNAITVSDIDGNLYNTITIGSQLWMKENLKVSKYRNGDPIPTNLDDGQWGSTNSGAYAIYGNDPINNNYYGKLYNWYTLVDSRGLCPNGWHPANDSEWKILESFLGMPANELDLNADRGVSQNIGGKLKLVSNSLWSNPNSGANNSTGFSAVGNGYRGSNGPYYGLYNGATWWVGTEFSNIAGWNRNIPNNITGVSRSNYMDKRNGLGVRCLKD